MDVDKSKVAFAELQFKGYARYEDLPLKTKDNRLINVEFVRISIISFPKKIATERIVPI